MKATIKASGSDFKAISIYARQLSEESYGSNDLFLLSMASMLKTLADKWNYSHDKKVTRTVIDHEIYTLQYISLKVVNGGFVFDDVFIVPRKIEMGGATRLPREAAILNIFNTQLNNQLIKHQTV